MDVPAAETWETLLVSVLDEADHEVGFCPPWRGLVGTVDRLPTDTDLVRIDVGGLTFNRILGMIEVDFAARVLRLVHIDYYGGDAVFEREVPPEFWSQAAQVAWPCAEATD
ncbi:MAG TPA: hypothetical protein DCR14_20495 [Acidimicrobiaceae bacterium]|nr:hypothetical protein [Acidimicrobiaceae bacterium]